MAQIAKKVLAERAEAREKEDQTPQNVEEVRDVTPARQKSTRQNPEHTAFAETLRKAMTKGKLSASEVARRVWGTTTDNRGYEVARNRDRIGHYLAGTSYPEPENLVKLADAVGLSVEELAIDRPETTNNPGPRKAGNLHVITFSLPDRPEKARVQLDLIVDWGTAMKIAELIKADEQAGAAGHPVAARVTLKSNPGNGNGNGTHDTVTGSLN